MNEAWVIKYKPQTIEQLIIPKKIKDQWSVESFDANVLFSGAPGTGKSSLANIISKNTNSKFIDCSTFRGIDTIRDQILTFGTVASLQRKSGKKTIVLDEVEGLTNIAQNALKATMDTVSKTTNFVLTTNHPERLIDALHSRLEHTKFNFEADDKREMQIQFIERIRFILKNEGYKISTDAITYLLTNIFPDIRQCLIILYKITRGLDKATLIDLSMLNDNASNENEALYQIITSPKTEPEIFVAIKGQYAGKYKDAFEALGDNFLQWLMKNNKEPEMVLTIAAIVHKYQFESSMTSYNPMLGLLACCNAINSFFKN